MHPSELWVTNISKSQVISMELLLLQHPPLLGTCRMALGTHGVEDSF